MAARKREPATRLRALGVLGALALFRILAPAPGRNLPPVKPVILAVRENAL